MAVSAFGTPEPAIISAQTDTALTGLQIAMQASAQAAAQSASQSPAQVVAEAGAQAMMQAVMPDGSAALPLAEMALAVPEDGIALDAVRVTVRAGGVIIFATPNSEGGRLGSLDEGEQIAAQSAVLRDQTWLQVLWDDGLGTLREGWIAGEATDFSRSKAYNQVSRRWADSVPVLAYRRELLRALLKARGVEQVKIDRVDAMTPEALFKFEDLLTRQTVPAEYVDLWRSQDRLRLPDPFAYLPVHPLPPEALDTLEIQGFGPTTFAYEQWPVYYAGTRGLHNGFDYMVSEGSPLLAVADGVIVDFRVLADANERTLALRPFLPDRLRRPDGSRALSNVIVVYGHLTGDPTSALVRVGDEVQAGQIIGTSGWPLYTEDDGDTQIQYNNAHLHLEVHLVTGSGSQPDKRQPFNPLLFFSPRLIALQCRLADHTAGTPYPKQGHSFGRLGFFTLGCFHYEPPTIVWEKAEAKEWPSGVVPLGKLLAMLGGAGGE